MGYDFHIDRGYDVDDELISIPLEEWKAAIESTENVRLYAEKFHIVDIGDGRRMKTPVAEGSAEAYFKDQWYPLFRFIRGKVSFSANAVGEMNNSDPVWKIATTLAKKVGAQIRGDDAGPFDLDK